MTILIPDRVARRAALRWEPGPGGCWISTYSVGSHGYAQIGWQSGEERHMTTAHRAAYQWYHGPVPELLTVDHRCHVKTCVRPEHLRRLPNLTNATDNGSAARRAATPVGRLCGVCSEELVATKTGAAFCRRCAGRRRAAHRLRTREARRHA